MSEGYRVCFAQGKDCAEVLLKPSLPVSLPVVVTNTRSGIRWRPVGGLLGLGCNGKKVEKCLVESCLRQVEEHKRATRVVVSVDGSPAAHPHHQSTHV